MHFGRLADCVLCNDFRPFPRRVRGPENPLGSFLGDQFHPEQKEKFPGNPFCVCVCASVFSFPSPFLFEPIFLTALHNTLAIFYTADIIYIHAHFVFLF